MNKFVLVEINFDLDNFLDRPVHCLYWLTAGVVGPHMGAVIGAWVYKFALSPASDENNDYKLTDINDPAMGKDKNLLEKTAPLVTPSENNKSIEVIDTKNRC